MNKEKWYLSVISASMLLFLIMSLFAGIFFGDIYIIFLLMIILLSFILLSLFLYIRIQHNIDRKNIKIKEYIQHKFNEQRNLQSEVLDFLENIVNILSDINQLDKKIDEKFIEQKDRFDKKIDEKFIEQKTMQGRLIEGFEDMVYNSYRKIEDIEKKLKENLENEKKFKTKK